MDTTIICHVIALPFPARGHINPMMNLCRSLASKRSEILITIIVTEEWLTLIGSEQKPNNIHFSTIPNVLTSERARAGKFPAFFEEVMSKMEEPVAQLLDHVEPPLTIIIADTYIPWAFEMAARRSIPAASLFTMSLTVYSVLHYFDLLVRKSHFPIDVTDEKQREVQVDYIPGVPPTRLVDLSMALYLEHPQVRNRVLESINTVSKAQYLLLCSAYELEAQQINALRSVLPLPIYHVGPTIPFLKLQENNVSISRGSNYFQWLDKQPIGSVLYVSQGSIHSASSVQLDEIAAGMRESGVKYLWVARGEATRYNEGCGDSGLLVPWCDQLKVLCHPSVGGFWSHCGWSSTMEAVFAGVPMLTFPLSGDQGINSKLIVEEWKMGCRVKNETDFDKMVSREEIAELVKRFMDSENDDTKELRRRAKRLREICRSAIKNGGSSDIDMENFVNDILQGCRR